MGQKERFGWLVVKNFTYKIYFNHDAAVRSQETCHVGAVSALGKKKAIEEVFREAKRTGTFSTPIFNTVVVDKVPALQEPKYGNEYTVWICDRTDLNKGSNGSFYKVSLYTV